MPKHRSTTERGFTLVELLIVIALIGILATILGAALNPEEIFKKSRDSVRLSDLLNVRKAIELAVSDGQTFDPNRCQPLSPCDSLSEGRASDGTGYVNINVTKFLAVLPADPQSAKGTFVDGKGNTVLASYQFATDGTDFEIRAHLEAKANTSASEGADRYRDDGGCNDGWYEVGTNLCLLN